MFVPFGDTAFAVARALEKSAMAAGRKLPDARAHVARQTGLSPGCIRRLSRGARRRVTVAEADALCAAYLREIERLIAQLQHDLDLARARGLRPDADDFLSAQTALASARALLTRTGAPPP